MILYMVVLNPIVQDSPHSKYNHGRLGAGPICGIYSKTSSMGRCHPVQAFGMYSNLWAKEVFSIDLVQSIPSAE